MKITRSEHDEQVELTEHCNSKEIPFFAIPNANKMSFLGRKMAIIIANVMRKEGAKKGIPDVCIPVMRIFNGRLCGALYIEMKKSELRNRKNGGRSEEQDAWINLLNSDKCMQYATTCFCAEDAIKLVDEYMASPVPIFDNQGS
jgi:hypothetical protein